LAKVCPDCCRLVSVTSARFASICMVHLCSLVLFTLSLLGTARRSVGIAHIFSDAEQQTDKHIQALEVSAETRDALFPGGVRTAPFRRWRPQTGGLQTALRHEPQLSSPHSQRLSMWQGRSGAWRGPRRATTALHAATKPCDERLLPKDHRQDRTGVSSPKASSLGSDVIAINRRSFMATVAAAALATMPGDVQRLAYAEELTQLPPGVRVLCVADMTDKMEKTMRQAAAYQRNPDRAGNGLVIGRPQMQQSISILLKNTKLEEAPGSRVAVRYLKGISQVAAKSAGPLTDNELLRMASLYVAARNALQEIFDGYTDDKQREYKQIFRALEENDWKLPRRPSA